MLLLRVEYCTENIVSSVLMFLISGTSALSVSFKAEAKSAAALPAQLMCIRQDHTVRENASIASSPYLWYDGDIIFILFLQVKN